MAATLDRLLGALESVLQVTSATSGIQYKGLWTHRTTSALRLAAMVSNTTGDTATLAFHGIGIQVFGIVPSTLVQNATYVLDGGPPVTYSDSAKPEEKIAFYTSPLLTDSTAHTLVVTNYGEELWLTLIAIEKGQLAGLVKTSMNGTQTSSTTFTSSSSEGGMTSPSQAPGSVGPSDVQSTTSLHGASSTLELPSPSGTTSTTTSLFTKSVPLPSPSTHAANPTAHTTLVESANLLSSSDQSTVTTNVASSTYNAAQKTSDTSSAAIPSSSPQINPSTSNSPEQIATPENSVSGLNSIYSSPSVSPSEMTFPSSRGTTQGVSDATHPGSRLGLILGLTFALLFVLLAFSMTMHLRRRRQRDVGTVDAYCLSQPGNSFGTFMRAESKPKDLLCHPKDLKSKTYPNSLSYSDVSTLPPYGYGDWEPQVHERSDISEDRSSGSVDIHSSPLSRIHSTSATPPMYS